MTNLPASYQKKLKAEAAKRNLKQKAKAPLKIPKPTPETESRPEAALDWKPLDLPPTWQLWIKENFPHVASSPFAKRHLRLWDWFDALKGGVRPRPRIEVWPRGGAKSSTEELAIAWIGVKLTRRFILIVSETQDQADKHVESIATLFERIGVGRAVGKYGNSRGWRRNQLRTDNGFNVAALGLDVAARGIKLDEFRPDGIFFDDIDNEEDSAKAIQKKIRSITRKILPAGSTDCAVLFLQNMIRDDGIVAQLVNGSADFLRDREPAVVEPAVYGLETEIVSNKEGAKVYKVTGGTPSWDGQNLVVCEAQINERGLIAFKREAQHEVEGVNGLVFKVNQFQTCKPEEVPELAAICLGGDLAGTEGGGDHTALALIGRTKTGLYYLLALIRGQWSSDRVQSAIKLASSHYKYLYPKMELSLPQDPGQAGKAQKGQMQRALASFSPTITPESGDKVRRAMPLAEEINLGNVTLVQSDLPAFLMQNIEGSPLETDLSWENWHRILKSKLKAIQEGEDDQEDDEMDALARAFNKIALARRMRSL